MNWRKSTYSSGSGNACVEVAAVPWRKSSYSGGGGQNCVEIAGVTGLMAVRDSKDQTGPVLSFGPAEWSAFVAGVRAGHYLR